MSEQFIRPPEETVGGPDPRGEGGLRAPAHYGTLRKVWWWFDFLVLVKLARLRFLAILAAVGAVILYWETLTAYYERWTRPARGGDAAAAVSDTEYWCPMHPSVVRDKPDKCPICGMPLSKRKKGEGAGHDEALPPGVVSRVQLTPYRVALAGIQTVEVGYQPLAKEITTVGFVEHDERRLARITARPAGKSRIDKLFVNVTGQQMTKDEPLARLYSAELVSTVQNLLDARAGGNTVIERGARDRLRLWGIDAAQIDQIVAAGKPITDLIIRAPISGHVIKKYQVEGDYVEEGARLYDVADLSVVWVEAQVYEDEVAFLQVGLPAAATTKAFPGRQFQGKVAFLNPHVDPATRTLKVRFDVENAGHDLRPGMYATVTLRVPATRLSPLPEGASEEEKQARSQGLVLAVPEQAVIDTGSRKLVYREAEPDVYEGVEVKLGPRCGAFYPVLAGLRAGDRVAAAGSFLIDAETRLTAGVGSTYFGASAGPQPGQHQHGAAGPRPSMLRDEEDKLKAALGKLSPEDRRLAEEQGYCPVLTDNRLGVMGVPIKVMVQGRPVFLCCKGCVTKALADPAKTLARLAEVKTRVKAGTPPPAPAGPKGKNAEIKAALAKLSPEDRKLAEEQGYCPESDDLLGSMGMPVKVVLKGQAVFLCCKGCVDEALQHPEQTLAKVAELKAKVKAAPAK